MLLHLLVLTSLFYLVKSKSFGHSMEYRFEYDPRKSDRPVVQWRYDDLLGRKTDSYSEDPVAIRKSPRKFFPKYESEYNSSPSPNNHGWYNGYNKDPKDKFEHQEFVEEMAAELRRQSEEIIASHFPTFPFQFYEQHPPPPIEYRNYW